MPVILTETEVRVLGSLIEKQLTTPENYPLTLKLRSLPPAIKKVIATRSSHMMRARCPRLSTPSRDKNLVYTFHGSTSRVVKYKHMFPNVFQ